jgi:hypothetical protein
MNKKALSERDICTKFITPATSAVRLDIEKARLATKSAIELYNNKRFRLSLGFKTSNMVFKSVA